MYSSRRRASQLRGAASAERQHQDVLAEVGLYTFGNETSSADDGDDDVSMDGGQNARPAGACSYDEDEDEVIDVNFSSI